jgi:WD40 repeat protein
VRLRGHTGRIRSITFHQEDDVLLTTSADKTARLWKLAPTKVVLEVLTLSGHRDAVGSGAFLPGGGVITVGDDGHARRWTPVWSLSQTERKATEPAGSRSIPNEPQIPPRLTALLMDPSNDCRPLRAAPGDSPLAYCPERNVVWIGHADRAALVEVPIAGDALVEFGHLSRSRRILALTLDDNSIRLFDARTGRPRAAMRGHSARVSEVAFTDDDRYLASIGRDSIARVWDVSRGTEIASVTLEASHVEAISFSRDGRSVFLDAPETRTTWRCYTCGDRELLLSEVSRRKVRALTPAERTRFFVDAGTSTPDESGGHAHLEGETATR